MQTNLRVENAMIKNKITINLMFILIFMMMLILMPTRVSATTYPYAIGANEYETLKEAIDSVESGGTATITVNQDVTDSSNAIIRTGKTITLDTNGYTIRKTEYTITNNGTLNISDVDINYTQPTDRISILDNYGTSTLNNVSISKGYYGIKNGASAILTLNSSDITASNAAIYNSGELHINGGIINGSSYGIYSNSNIDMDIQNASIISASNTIYKRDNSSVITITDTNLVTGQLYNLNGTINIDGGTISGTINNESTMTIDGSSVNNSSSSVETVIKNTSSLTIDNVIFSLNSSNRYGYEAIYSTGTLDVSDSQISIARSASSGSSYNVIGIYNNGGSVTSTRNGVKIEDTEITTSTKRITLQGMKNLNGISFESTDDVITLINGGTTYGMYTSSAEASDNISNLSITSSGSNNAYGIYNAGGKNIIDTISINVSANQDVYGIYDTGGEIIMDTGTIDVSSNNTYGIYIANVNSSLTLGVEDGSGLETASVSISNPFIRAMGTTSGIGVKKDDGTFNFYDGKIIGSTYAKPDTTSLVEPRFEARFYVVDNLGNETKVSQGQESNYTYEYEYCILEYQG